MKLVKLIDGTWLEVRRTSYGKLLRNLAIVCFGLSGVMEGQVANPIPPPLTPGNQVSNLNSSVGHVRAKASPDECWTGLGENTQYDFINQSNPSQPCNSNQTPKVDQGYPWGAALVGNQLFFGTFANVLCIGPNKTGNPYAIPGQWGCEYADSPYAEAKGGPLPDNLGDYRPSRMYIYNVVTHSIQDITPMLGGSTPATTPPSSVCGPTTATNGACLDTLWNATLGIRSATSYVEPTTGRTYVIVSGTGTNGINYFCWGITENRWVGKYTYPNEADMRHWLNSNGVLYGAIFGPNSTTGSLFRYTGNFQTAHLPAQPVPSASNGYNAIPTCGTNSTSIPPVGASFCIAFQDVGDFNGPASEVNVAPAGTPDAGRIFVGTWAPPFNGTNANNVVAGIFMSPVVPAGGLTSANASQWTEVWNAAQYDPDPVLVTTYGVGGMTWFDGYLYWGTLNPPLSGLEEFIDVYGPLPPLSSDEGVAEADDVLYTDRTAVMFRGQNFSSGAPSINLLYGATQLAVYTPTDGSVGTWTLTNNNIPTGSCTTACGVAPLYGPSGFGNPYTAYIWTMAIWNSQLYFGTMQYSFLIPGMLSNIGVSVSTLPPALVPNPATYGGALYYFANTTTAAIPVSTDGVGNYLNYGIRNLIPYSSTSLLLGMANPMNLETSGNSNAGTCSAIGICHGGWEIIEINPASTVITR